ncbi:sulfite exporter TauE/SafE family protein [Paenibacillus sp. GCM10023252]|uniref:sulfite exporter TauE/SafE family protein n=1 Tax=Paenibacillus sp. GCM10023252 TaxID=3252649 RepID=UPI00360FD240
MILEQWGLVVVTGLLSAPHCIGMCGGIVSSVSLQSRASIMRTTLLYNVGRVTSYTVLGVLMGLAGSFLDLAGRLAGLQGAASILGGLLLLLWLWRRFQLPLMHGLSAFLHKRLAVPEQPIKLTKRQESLHLLLTGLAFGYLPCGLTYAMQMNAAATGSPWQGGAVMALFGLATFPALAAASFIAAYAGKRWRRFMRRAGTISAAAVGVLSILRGLAANGLIPSLTPWLW